MTDTTASDAVLAGWDNPVIAPAYEQDGTPIAPGAPAGRTPDEVLGEVVHVYLRRKGAHQKMLAAHMNVTQATISNKLRGTRPWTWNDILKTAEFLGIGPAELVGQCDALLPHLDSNQEPADLRPHEVSAVTVLETYRRQRAS